MINKDEQDMKESVDASINKEHSMIVSKPSAPASQKVAGVGIGGMEDIPASMIALPYCKLVQRSSTKTILIDGKDATPGNYYFTDTQEQFDKLEFVILRALVNKRVFIQDGEERHITQLLSLCMTADLKRLFILMLPVTSFTSWGKLIAKFKSMGTGNAWEYIIEASSEKRENQKGQFYVANLQLGKKLTKEQQDAMAEKYGEYGAVLERRDIVEEAENQTED